ncbi:winged helix-turn-helix domain-containing protein [uncultured Desulfobacter sp.]|uniref:winged helix-turn-helix domain-containing protein n=1 Tax=uncultured Desulfobacter sp. TaxID=240139 RepID=UPI0029F5558D|nr:winged helix-turn-helix domain-containing protein [uncultured Desulfobacter sp.]
MERPNRVFTCSQLIDTVQGYNYDGYERTIDFHIKNLRKKIAADLPGRKVIQSSYV